MLSKSNKRPSPLCLMRWRTIAMPLHQFIYPSISLAIYIPNICLYAFISLYLCNSLSKTDSTFWKCRQTETDSSKWIGLCGDTTDNEFICSVDIASILNKASNGLLPLHLFCLYIYSIMWVVVIEEMLDWLNVSLFIALVLRIRCRLNSP